MDVKEKANDFLELIKQTKERLDVLSALSLDLKDKIDNESIDEEQRLHVCRFSVAATDLVSVLINFNNKYPKVELCSGEVEEDKEGSRDDDKPIT